MTDINTVVVVGRLTKNAEFRQLANTYQCKFSIANNRARKVDGEWKEEVSYIDILAWGRLAENMQGKLPKGTKVTVNGYLRQERWEMDNEKKSKLVVLADQIDIHTPREAVNGF